MTDITIIISVVESDTGYDVGQFALNTSMASVPRAGEGLFVAGEGQRIQDVLWFLGGPDTVDRVEVILSTRRVGPHEPHTLHDLKDAGFLPITQHGEPMTWEEFGATPETTDELESAEA